MLAKTENAAKSVLSMMTANTVISAAIQNVLMINTNALAVMLNLENILWTVQMEKSAALVTTCANHQRNVIYAQ